MGGRVYIQRGKEERGRGRESLELLVGLGGREIESGLERKPQDRKGLESNGNQSPSGRSHIIREYEKRGG